MATPKMMKRKVKRWSELTTEELAEATRQFDDPSCDPPAREPTAAELAQLRRVQTRAAKRRLRIAIALEQKLVDQTDEYAAAHGVTFSDVVSDALKRMMQDGSPGVGARK